MNRLTLVEKINALSDRGAFEQVLVCLEQLIEFDGETEKILDYKFDLLMKLGKYQEAVIAALKLEEISTRKSPWNCLKILEYSTTIYQAAKQRSFP